MSELRINEQSIKTELKAFREKPYKCLFEYIWNSFDAQATQVFIDFKLPESVVNRVKDVKISDNGCGWDFKNKLNTETFLCSSKSQISEDTKTIPKGRFGRGRYAFIWIADRIEIYSKKKKLILVHNTKIDKKSCDKNVKGTEVHFKGIYNDFSECLEDDRYLFKELQLEFGWFLEENSKYRIKINKTDLDISNNIKEKKEFSRSDFPNKLRDRLDKSFKAKVVLWEDKPSEYSKFYFLDENHNEVFKQNTGLNKKGDQFWHSVYIYSTLFKDLEDSGSQEVNGEQTTIEFEDRQIRNLKNDIEKQLKKELVIMRKPYLVEQSGNLLEELKEERIIPELTSFGIYDEASYNELIKKIYTITPQLFAGKGAKEKKFICATFAGLLSIQDNNLIKTILEQLQELNEEEQKDLLDILQRSSLSSVVRTIKEIDNRLAIIDKLKFLISEKEKETLEVKHLQKILDENFWIFGEQYRLFSSTEGQLKTVLKKYAREILGLENPKLTTQPRGEVDLFLTKTEYSYSSRQKNIIVELKRASRMLRKEHEYTQIDKYKDSILKQNLCNGENQSWEFILIGKDYDQGIKELIESAGNHGEKEKGLTLNLKEGKVKMYVRKWSDILEVEWGTKMKYLKENLRIKARTQKDFTPEEIVSQING